MWLDRRCSVSSGATDERWDRHKILRRQISSRRRSETDGHFRQNTLCVRPSLPLQFESSIFIMDGGVSGECLDYGGKSKWLGKPLQCSVSRWSMGEMQLREVTGRREKHPKQHRVYLHCTSLGNGRRFLDRRCRLYVMLKCPLILFSPTLSGLSSGPRCSLSAPTPTPTRSPACPALFFFLFCLRTRSFPASLPPQLFMSTTWNRLKSVILNLSCLRSAFHFYFPSEIDGGLGRLSTLWLLM